MPGTITRKHPKIIDSVKLANLAKRFVEVGRRNANAKEELGSFAFKEMFNNNLTEAVHFGTNGYYVALLSMARDNTLG